MFAHYDLIYILQGRSQQMFSLHMCFICIQFNAQFWIININDHNQMKMTMKGIKFSFINKDTVQKFNAVKVLQGKNKILNLNNGKLIKKTELFDRSDISWIICTFPLNFVSFQHAKSYTFTWC